MASPGAAAARLRSVPNVGSLQEAIQDYLLGEWRKARATLAKCLKQLPSDQPAKRIYKVLESTRTRTHAPTHASVGARRHVPSLSTRARLFLAPLSLLRAAIGEPSGPNCVCFVCLFVGDGGPELPMPEGLAGLPRAHL